jgi:hypothetical protein
MMVLFLLDCMEDGEENIFAPSHYAIGTLPVSGRICQVMPRLAANDLTHGIVEYFQKDLCSFLDLNV